jgi:hypothetical protein
MAPIISEDPSYEENELKKYRDFSCMFCNRSHEKDSGRRGYCIASWYHRNLWKKMRLLFQDEIFRPHLYLNGICVPCL